MAKRKTLTADDINSWADEHLTRIAGRPNFYRVKKEIHSFKKVYTYFAREDDKIVVCPHKLEMPEDILNFGSNSAVTSNSFDRTQAIANLIIPVGEEVFIDEYKIAVGPNHLKMRASSVQVHSIVRVSDKKQVAFARAGYDQRFVYLNPKLVGTKGIAKPSNGWNRCGTQCAGGIHFYINVEAALNH